MSQKDNNETWLARLRRRFARDSAEPEYNLPVFVPPIAADDEKLPLRSAREAVIDGALAAEDAVAWRSAMLNHLQPADLAAIAAAVEVPFTPEGGKGRQVLALMQAAQRLGKFDAVADACRARRPAAPWPTSTASE